MVGLIKQVFFVAMTFSGFNPSNVNSLEYISMNNQECKARTKIIMSLFSILSILK